MKKGLNLFVLSILILGLLSCSPGFAKNSDSPRSGKISGKTVAAGALSLLIWPGIGQAVNNDKSQKVLTHAMLGLLPHTVSGQGMMLLLIDMADIGKVEFNCQNRCF